MLLVARLVAPGPRCSESSVGLLMAFGEVRGAQGLFCYTYRSL